MREAMVQMRAALAGTRTVEEPDVLEFSDPARHVTVSVVGPHISDVAVNERFLQAGDVVQLEADIAAAFGQTQRQTAEGDLTVRLSALIRAYRDHQGA